MNKSRKHTTLPDYRDRYFFFSAGNKGVQTLNLINDEDKPFQFNFDKESLYAPGRIAHLTVVPISGTIEAKSK